MKRWYKPEETVQLACPLSVGQAESGRYTYCVSEKCMAWTWMTTELDEETIDENDDVPVGWKVNSEPFKVGKKTMVKIIKVPTYGRCGMVLS
jgi:hypothetical protein